MELGPIPEYRRRPGLKAYTIDLPPFATSAGFDTILVTPPLGDNHYAIGHLLLDGYPDTDGELHRRMALRDGPVQRQSGSMPSTAK